MTSGSGYEGANYAVEFDEMERTTSLTCEVRGPVSKRDSSFYEVICEFLSQDVPYPPGVILSAIATATFGGR